MDKSEIIKLISNKIFEAGGRAFFVGGYVRDYLLNIQSDDYDIEVHNLGADKLYEILTDFGEINTDGKEFGVYKLIDFNIDFALPRIDKRIGNNHRDFKIIIDENLDLKQSSIRRDFTINSMLMDVITGEIFDYYNGQLDLKNKIIRCVDKNTFGDDPLRVLRAYQFASRLNFKIEDYTSEICKNVNLNNLSIELIENEIEKVFKYSNNPSIFFKFIENNNPSFEYLKKLFSLKKYKFKNSNYLNIFYKIIDYATMLYNKKIVESNFIIFILNFFSDLKILNLILSFGENNFTADDLNKNFKGCFFIKYFKNNKIKSYSVSLLNSFINLLILRGKNSSKGEFVYEILNSKYNTDLRVIFDLIQKFDLNILLNYGEYFSEAIAQKNVEKITSEDLHKIGIKDSEYFGILLKKANIEILNGKLKKVVLDELK